VKVYNQNGSLRFLLMAYESTFSGGVRVAMSDVTGDGVLDLVTGTGVGGGPLVKVFDGRNGTLVRSFFAYESTFRGGVNVAAVGATIVTGPGVGGGPVIRLFDGATGAMSNEFLAYDSAFRGGVTVAAWGFPSSLMRIVTAPGPGGGPHIKVFGGTTHTNEFSQPIAQFLAYDSAFRGGVTVAVGDVDGDGNVDILTSPGPGIAPQVKAFRFTDKYSEPHQFILIRSFDAYASAFHGGVSVTAADLNGDGIADIITAPGKGGGPHVRAFDGATGANILNFFPFDPSFTGGVFVG
jgi:hypothetical protein